MVELCRDPLWNSTQSWDTSSPALSRKSSKTNVAAEVGQEGGPRETGEAKVSEEISDMVEQIQAIQADISQLAGRPISLYEYHRT